MNKPTTPTDLARSRMDGNEKPMVMTREQTLIVNLGVALESARDLLASMPAELTDDHQDIGDEIAVALESVEEYVTWG